jgi:hypothetical protein
LLAVEKRYARPTVRWVPLLAAAPWLIRSRSDAHLWRVQRDEPVDAGRSRLDASCLAGAMADRLVCSAFDGTRTRIVAIDPESGSMTGLAIMTGRFHASGRSAQGWLTGWLDSTALAVRLATADAIRPPARRHEFVQIVTTTEAVMGTVTWSDEGSRVRVYPLPTSSRTAAR